MKAYNHSRKDSFLETPNVSSQTIDRAMQVLACFSPDVPYLKLAEIAERLQQHPSTVYRYVSSLETAGLLTRDNQRGGYQLGLRIIEMAGIVLNQLDVRRHAVDEMDALQEEVQMMVNLGILYNWDVMHVAHSAGNDVPRIFTTLGRRAISYCTALGKVLLSDQTWEDVERFIQERGWQAYTEHSIQDFDRLKKELETIRKQGYAIDMEERRIGVVCLAVPIRDASGVVAALSISGSIQKITPETRQKFLSSLLRSARRISLRLDYQSDVHYPDI